MGEPMDVELDFKSQFYNLQGIHINERKKNFYKLLHSTKTDIPDDQIDILPRNYQENIFYVDVLIHFKKVEQLIEILKGGIGVLTSKILKQEWFFQEAFKDMSEEDVVNNFLPTLSYSLRMKVLKKLSLIMSEAKMDGIFDLVLERYGLFTAKQFLFGCSPEKIAHVLRNNEVTLLAEQLKRLLQKDVELVKLYIKEYKKNTGGNFEDFDFLNYLIWKQPNLYYELGIENKYCMKGLGRNTTRAVIKTNKQDVLTDIKDSHLNKAALTREIREFDKEYLFQFFPDNMETIDSYQYLPIIDSFVSKYPVKKRWEIFSCAFMKAYGKDILEHLDVFEDNLVKFFPEKIQQKWAKIKYLQNDYLKYLKYYEPKSAFKVIQDKINVTSEIYSRGGLLNELITVCYEHKDYSTYTEVLKYICIRHRNDDRNVRTALMSHIEKNIDYDVITESHWKYINELIDVQRVRNESLSFELISNYLVFVGKNKLPLDAQATQYAKDCIQSDRTFRLWSQKELKEVEVESSILKYIAKILHTLDSLENENSKNITCRLMSNIVDFNKELKNDTNFKKDFVKHWINLEDCQLIVNLIKDVLGTKKTDDMEDYGVVSGLVAYNCLYSHIPLKVDEDDLLNIVNTMSNDKHYGYMVNDSVLDVIKKPKRNYFENTLLHQFFNNTNQDMKNAIKHFLAHEPEIISKYFSVILLLQSKSDYELLDYSIIRRYSHLGLVDKTIAHFKPLVEVKSKCSRKGRLLNALSRVMTTRDFLDLVKDYTPKAKKLNLDNTVQKEMYQVQCDVAKAFKNLEEVTIMAPTLIHFCQGDYLQSSLIALYSALYRINEGKALSYITVLKDRAVSTRKHAVFLSFELLSLKDAMVLYSMVSNKETNISAKKYLFRSILKYFIRNPLRHLLDVALLNLHYIDKNDSQMIRALVESVNNIPKEYKPVFIENVWMFLDTLDLQEVKIASYRAPLLEAINIYGDSFILGLNKSFCEDVIKKYFLSSNIELVTRVNKIDFFVMSFLMAYSDEQHFEFIFNIIKGYKEIQWKSNNKDNISYIFRFFGNTYRRFDASDIKILKLFTHFWQQLFDEVESFYHFTMLRLMTLYKQNTNIEVFCKEVNKFFQELTVKDRPCLSELLIKSITTFFSHISPKDNADFNLGNFAFYLLQSDTGEFNCFIVFKIIQEFTSKDQEKIYLKVVDALKSVDNFTARVCCNVLLKGV